MNKIVKIFAIEFIGLYVANQLADGFSFNGNQLYGFIITAGALTIAMKLVKPIINILILPLSLATMGLFKFISHTVTLYIIDLALDQFKVTHFYFAGFSNDYFDLPVVSFNQGIMAYIAFSIIISAVVSIVSWIMK